VDEYFEPSSPHDVAYIISLMGPTLTFDKSFLQSLNADEATWLDQFFSCNITPLFFIETLADIEKEVHRGKTPEQVVGALAYKTPDMHRVMNPFHGWLIPAELSGIHQVDMTGRMYQINGSAVALGGRKGVVFRPTREEEAFQRWQQGEFLDLERQIAKAWRRSVTAIDHSKHYEFFNKVFEKSRKPRNLVEAKNFTDSILDSMDPLDSLSFGMLLFGIPSQSQLAVLQRWRQAGMPAVGNFTPYFRHALGVELFFHLAVAADLISRIRPTGKADNKVDVAYLFYLPFCRIFASSDNLHERTVPLFLRLDQSFVKGPDLKAALRAIDEHYDRFPADLKARGFYAYADTPPEDTSFFVTQLWDKHVPHWREQKAKHKKLTPEQQQALMDLVKKLSTESTPASEAERPKSIEDVAFVHVERKIMRSKGKWTRVPPEAK
jgi:hypothetical protein